MRNTLNSSSPWRIAHSASGNHYWIKTDNQEDHVIAEMGQNFGKQSEDEFFRMIADAQLLSVAPDLVEVVNLIIGHVDFSYWDLDVVNFIFSTLAKAEGEPYEPITEEEEYGSEE